MPMPIRRIVFGKLEAIVWCGVREDGRREYTTTIERLVETENGSWKRVRDLSPLELRLLPSLADQVYDFIREARRIDRENTRQQCSAGTSASQTRTR